MKDLIKLYATFFAPKPEPKGPTTGRRSCSEPVQQVVAKDGSIERRHKGKLVDVMSFGARHVNPTSTAHYVAPTATIVGADYANLERHIEAFCIAPLPHRDSPAGHLAGVFWLYREDLQGHCERAVIGGNARQRRRQIRAWKRQGFTITQTHALTGAIIRR